MKDAEGQDDSKPAGIAAEVSAQLAMLLDGAEKTFDNAEQLFREAHALTAIGGVARALCLHQISLEECSKVDSLGAWATSVVLGFAIDEKRVLKGLTRHDAKNKLNAYMLEVSGEELAARERGDWDASMAAFRQTQQAFHQASNDAKNHSLYVDWGGAAFVSPADRITKEMLADVAARNQTFLGYAWNNLKTLRGLVADPEKRRNLMLAFVNDLEALRGESSQDRMDKAQVLLERFLADGMAALGPEDPGGGEPGGKEQRSESRSRS